MATFLTNKVAKHVLKESAQNHFGSDDPYFEYVAPTDVNGNPSGKPVKQRRPVPQGLTKQEEKVLKKVTRRAHRLDNCLNICGIRVGWSAVIGILPVAGDAVDAFMALMIVWTCMQVKIPDKLKSRMMFNITLDFMIGLVPFLGDVADAFYRCNTRNAALLYKHLEARGAARLREQAGGKQPDSRRSRSQTRPSPPKQSHSHRTGGEIATQEAPAQHAHKVHEKSRSRSQSQNRRMVTAADLPKPQPAKVKENKKSDGSGWFSRLTGPRPAPHDVEHDGTEMTERP